MTLLLLLKWTICYKFTPVKIAEKSPLSSLSDIIRTKRWDYQQNANLTESLFKMVPFTG